MYKLYKVITICKYLLVYHPLILHQMFNKHLTCRTFLSSLSSEREDWWQYLWVGHPLVGWPPSSEPGCPIAAAISLLPPPAAAGWPQVSLKSVDSKDGDSFPYPFWDLFTLPAFVFNWSGKIPIILSVINFPFSSSLLELRLNILRTSHPFRHFLDHIYSFHCPISSVLFIFKHNCFCNLGLAIANLKWWACFSCWAPVSAGSGIEPVTRTCGYCTALER